MVEKDTRNPPSVQRVKLRLMMLWANSGRAFLEGEYADDPETGAEIADPLREWIVTYFGEHATPGELQRHKMPFGSWDEATIRNYSWDREGGIVLEWALRLREDLPPWDTQDGFGPGVDDFFDFPDPVSWRPDLSLRPVLEMDTAAQAYETCIWRIRNAEDMPRNPGYVYKLLSRAQKLGHINLASDGDLAMSNGESLALTSKGRASDAQSVVVERLEALNWLCGEEEEWDRVVAHSAVDWLWDQNWKED